MRLFHGVDSIRGSFCRAHYCRWVDTLRGVCNNPGDLHRGECDYAFAVRCPACGQTSVCTEGDDWHCPYCGAKINRRE